MRLDENKLREILKEELLIHSSLFSYEVDGVIGNIIQNLKNDGKTKNK